MKWFGRWNIMKYRPIVIYDLFLNFIHILFETDTSAQLNKLNKVNVEMITITRFREQIVLIIEHNSNKCNLLITNSKRQ